MKGKSGRLQASGFSFEKKGGVSLRRISDYNTETLHTQIDELEGTISMSCSDKRLTYIIYEDTMNLYTQDHLDNLEILNVYLKVRRHWLSIFYLPRIAQDLNPWEKHKPTGKIMSVCKQAL